MKKKHVFTGYLLIIIGLFFLLRQLKLPIITNSYSWQTIFIIFGGIFLIYSFARRNGKYAFLSTILLGIGVHFYGVEHYHFWIDHWGVFLLIVGIAFLLKAILAKKGYVTAILLILISIALIFSPKLNPYLYWIDNTIDFIKKYWSIILIVLGIYLLRKKR